MARFQLLAILFALCLLTSSTIEASRRPRRLRQREDDGYLNFHRRGRMPFQSLQDLQQGGKQGGGGRDLFQIAKAAVPIIQAILNQGGPLASTLIGQMTTFLQTMQSQRGGGGGQQQGSGTPPLPKDTNYGGDYFDGSSQLPRYDYYGLRQSSVQKDGINLAVIKFREFLDAIPKDVLQTLYNLIVILKKELKKKFPQFFN